MYTHVFVWDLRDVCESKTALRVQQKMYCRPKHEKARELERMIAVRRVQNNSICNLLSKQSTTQEQSEYYQWERQWMTNATSFWNTDATRSKSDFSLEHNRCPHVSPLPHSPFLMTNIFELVHIVLCCFRYITNLLSFQSYCRSIHFMFGETDGSV